MNRHRRRNDQHGQVIVLFALLLVVMIAFAGLLIDGGLAWSNRRAAQSAADTAALAGAGAAAKSQDPTSAAQTVATANGFPTTYTDCDGDVQTDGVVVNVPPAEGPHAGDDSFVEVTTTRAQQNFFSNVVGQGCWLVSARGVAEIAVSAAATCNFCSLNNSSQNHTLLLQNGSTLRVDGDIYTNSSNGGTTGACTPSKWKVCGDGFDIFGTPTNPPAYISAKTISVVGGWETHDQNVVVADAPLTPNYSTTPPTYSTCAQHPNPPSQTQVSNVCIHVPQIIDPLNDPAHPESVIPTPVVTDYVVPNLATCPNGTVFPSPSAANTTPLAISSNATICPGIYYGGVRITAGTTTMLTGVYIILGNGFQVSGAASLDGSSGVMIYNSSGSGINISPNPDLAGDPNPAFPVPTVTLTSDHNPASVGQVVTYKFNIKRVGGKTAPNLFGNVKFYDGDTEISSTAVGSTCPSPITAGTLTNSGDVTISCKVTWTAAQSGTHGISAVFFNTGNGTNTYNNAESVLDPQQTVLGLIPPGTISIVTTGNVKLSGLRTSIYKGVVIFQDRTSNHGITISPGSGLGPCTPSNPITVNGVTGPSWALMQPPPDPCGALGGVDGTIYAANSTALVTVTASGLADLQIIAGKILIKSTVIARFAYDASKFAGGKIRLIE